MCVSSVACQSVKGSVKTATDKGFSNVSNKSEVDIQMITNDIEKVEVKNSPNCEQNKIQNDVGRDAFTAKVKQGVQ